MEIKDFFVNKGLYKYEVRNIVRKDVDKVNTYLYEGKVYKTGRAWDTYENKNKFLFKFEIKCPNVDYLYNKIYKRIGNKKSK